MLNDPFIIKEGNVKDSFIKDYINNQESGNFFNFRVTDKVQRLGQYINYKKLILINKIIYLIFILIFFRLIYLQLINGDNYRVLAEGNRIRLDQEIAKRGIFYDRYGKILVYNKPMFTLYLSSGNIDSTDDFKKNLYLLNDILLLTDEQIDDLIKIKDENNYLPLLIKEDLNFADAINLKIKTQKINGFFVNDETYRYYPEGPVIAHLLGYLGKISKDDLSNKERYSFYEFTDNLGKTGLEYVYEKNLKGINGYKEIEVDSLGKEKKIISQKQPINGDNLVLTIDLELQKKIYQILNEQLKKNNLSKAAAVATNPQNGEVLALVSLPSFDNNVFSKGLNQDAYNKITNDPNKPLFNRTISGEYPSGSTIKPAIAAAALQENVISENTNILSTGGIWYGQWFFPDWKAGGHGSTNVIKALAESVNTFFYYLGIDNYNDFKGLGINRLTSYLNKFGFGKISGIDLPSETIGFIPTPEWKENIKNESWYPGDTLHLSIGQGDFLATPLQINNLTSYFANNGIIYKPHLIKTILNEKEEIIINNDIIVKDLISNNNINIIKDGLKAVTTWGSARYLANLPIETGGKTGTAQVGNNKLPHAWFTVFAPFTNAEIVLTIIIENGGEGSSVAVPVANEVLKWYFNRNN